MEELIVRGRLLFVALTASLLAANAFAATTNQVSKQQHAKTAHSGQHASKKKHHQNGNTTAHKKGKAHTGQRHV